MTALETLARVEQACAAQLRDALAVTFTTIAEKSGISRTTLYRDESLRAVVVEYRTRSHDPRSLSGLVAEVGHCGQLSKSSPNASGATKNNSADSVAAARPVDRRIVCPQV